MAEARFLLDSNICIYILEASSPPLLEHLRVMEPGTLVASSIVYAEVMRGIPAGDRRRNRAAEGLFQRVPVLPFDGSSARRFRDLPFHRGSFDRLIAAHALALDLTVVTANIEDFEDVPGLRLEDWTR